MKRFADLVIRFRLLIIVLVTMVTIFFAYHLKDIKVNSDMLSYLKQDDPAVQLFNRIGEQFAGNSMAMIGLEADDIFDYSTLVVIDSLTQAIAQVPGVASVTSLTDILDIRTVEGGLEVGRLIDKNNIPRSQEELKRIRDYTLSKDMYTGSIVSQDGKITIIVARLKPDADKQNIALKIRALARQKAANYKLYFSGLPMQMLEINDIIIKDMVRLVPVVALMLVFMLFFSFRNKRGVLLPLLTVFISTIWAMGLMSLRGVELSIISNIMPVLLLAIGSAYGIHMLSRYLEDIQHCKDVIPCIKGALSEVGIPIILAGVTTLIGFFSFVGSYLTSVTDFGIYTGIGVGFALLIAVTLIPALLSYLKPPAIKRTAKGKEDNFLVTVMDRLALFVLKNEKLILITAGVLIVLAVFTLPRLKREVNLIEYFPENTDIRISENMMNEKFGGSTPIQILVQGDLKDPQVLKQMRRLERFMERLPYVNKPQSVADLICEMNRVMNHHYTIPETRQGVTNLWFFIESESVMEQLVNPEANEGIIQANLATLDTEKRNRTVEAINRFIATELDSVISVIPVNQTTRTTLRPYLLQQLTRNVRFDLGKNKVDEQVLKKLIQKIVDDSTLSLSRVELGDVQSKLNDFFLNESEVEIEDQNTINKITKAVLNELQQGRLPDKAALEGILLKYLKNRNLYYREDITDTAHSLWFLLHEVAQLSRVQRAVDTIVQTFAPEASNNQDLRDDLRDDLWLMNERFIGLPSEKAQTLGLSGPEVRVRFVQSGMPVVFTRLDESLMKSQIQSLLLAFVLVLIILVIQLRSFMGGLIAASPIALTVLFNFALMALFNIPLDNATMMIASIAIGIGIDYAIHFTSRFKEEAAHHASESEALEKTLTTTGKAIIINALSVGFGFLVLIFAQLIPIQRFGWLTATTMLFSSLGAITFLPSLILITKARFVGFAQNQNKIKKD